MKRNIPAFPSPYSKDDLRDYFAGQVLVGIMQQHALRFDPKDDANYCYRVADAMMKERDKE